MKVKTIIVTIIGALAFATGATAARIPSPAPSTDRNKIVALNAKRAECDRITDSAVTREGLRRAARCEEQYNALVLATFPRKATRKP
jgi:hypothetical protein